MEISGIEKFSRGFALLALTAAILLGGMIHFGYVKMPGTRAAIQKPAAQATLKPRRPAPSPDDATPLATGDEAGGEGTFQSNSQAATGSGNARQQ